MSEFVVCTKCQCLELTAQATIKPPQVLCSLCDPATQEWHGIFKREKYNPVKHAGLVESSNIGLG